MENEVIELVSDKPDLSFLACNSDDMHFSKSLSTNNVIMCIDGVEVIFKVTDDRFDVEYDKDKITASASVFFECLGDYFNHD